MKKILLRVSLIVSVILILLVLVKIYQFMIVRNLYEAIENFKNAENRYYSVCTKKEGNMESKESIFLKDKVVKYIKENNNSFCEWINLENNEKYSINLDTKQLYKESLLLHNAENLPQLPNFISAIRNDNKFSISEIFGVYYIIPIKYHNKQCYKIVTRTEITIIDADTYLPVFSSMKLINIEQEINNTIEKTYEFKIGEVTDEDVALPNASDYTLVDKTVE